MEGSSLSFSGRLERVRRGRTVRGAGLFPSIGLGALRWALVCMLGISAARLEAHWSSDSQLDIVVTNGTVRIQWAILWRDLDALLRIDDNGDGIYPESEWGKRADDVNLYAASHLGVRLDGTVGALEPGAIRSMEAIDGVYGILEFLIRGVGDPEKVELDYRLFEGLDPHHRGLVRLTGAGQVQTAILDQIEPQQVFILARPNPREQFWDFGRKGVYHIWTGADHLLFLLALLLPSVLRWRDGRWEPVERLGQAGWAVLKVVTCFTVAHSLTLGLAAAGVVSLPPRPVETVIALSVALAAANNLRPIWRGGEAGMAFGFGLVHGFGFASILLDLGLSARSLLWPLAGFNAGVELGQLACVAVFFPVAAAMRGKAVYPNHVLRWGSGAILLVSAGWAMERATGGEWMPF